jgi:filamentous hemagglutinin family protein
MILRFFGENHSVAGRLTVFLLAVVAENGFGQVVLDGKFGTSGAVTGPNFNITAAVGAARGNNLFHSFTQFDLKAGDIATFSGPANIQNILSRVTGGSASSINGTIRSTIAGANFFLINPSGVMFGPNAAVNVSGAFAASTADYLKLADDARFVAALDADDSGLSTAPVSTFGFLGNNPGDIAVNRSALRVSGGKVLSLVGGDITVDGGSVQSPAGQINLVSVQSAGEAPVDPGTFSRTDFGATFPQQGQINLQNRAQADVSGAGGGRIVIRGGQLRLDDSRIQANTTGSTAGQGIDIAVVGELDLIKGGQINSLSTSGLGAGGNINLSAESIRLDGGGLVDEDFNPTTQISTGSGQVFAGGGPATGGDIVIQAGSLELVNSAQISSATYGEGNAGRIEITASSVRLDAVDTTLAEISANTWKTIGAAGNAGDIVIRTGTLDLLNGASLLAATFGTGNAGRIEVTAKSVNMLNSGVITPATFGAGNGGSIAVNADSVLLDASFIQGVTTFVAADPASAKGGNISITTGSIEIRNGGQVSATTLGSGAAGTVTLTADSIRLTGDTGTSGMPTGIRAASGQQFGDVVLVGTGNGGDIVIKPKNPGALDLVISDGAQISTSTLGSGSGGRIDISASSLRLDSGGNISSASTSLAPGAGTAGNVMVKVTDSIVLTDLGFVSTAAPNAQGGNIDITAGNQIQLVDSQITAQAGPGGGGSITLMAPSLIYLLNGTLTAQAVGDGGNLSIVGPEFFIMNNGGLISMSSSANGGNITILSDYFFQSASTIDASAPFGLPGTVSVSAPQVDLSGSLIGLPGNLLDAASQLRPDCAVRLAGDVSSFIVLGRGGLPLAPGGFVPSGTIAAQ